MKVEKHSHYELVIDKIELAKKGDFSSLGWLIGFATVETSSPLSMFIKKEVYKIRNKEWEKDQKEEKAKSQ